MEKAIAEGKFKIPGDIQSVEDTRRYVGSCIGAMLDDRNYDEPVNGHNGVAYLSSIADGALVKMGFGSEAARWMTHPFHWLFACDSNIVELKSFKKPMQINGETRYGVWVLNREKTDSGSVDSLTNTFMEKYGGLFYTKMKCIEKDPNYCRN